MARYIDAEKLLERLNDLVSDNKDIQWAISDAIPKEIEKVPTADVKEIARGEWTDPDIDMYCIYICSNCNEYSEYDSPFCPNCGAIMKIMEEIQ